MTTPDLDKLRRKVLAQTPRASLPPVPPITRPITLDAIQPSRAERLALWLETREERFFAGILLLLIPICLFGLHNVYAKSPDAGSILKTLFRFTIASLALSAVFAWLITTALPWVLRRVPFVAAVLLLLLLVSMIVK